MSEQVQQPAQNTENKPSDKELNFRALEAKYQRQLEEERNARLEAERKAQEVLSRKHVTQDDDEDEDEPYVNPKRLEKKLSSFERKLEEKIDKKAEEKARALVEKERRENWIRQNPDFYEILQQHADTFAKKDPELAEAILEMPDNFERQKLVYKNIKALGIHKPITKEPSIQDKIDANRRSPYYQPTGVSGAPYNHAAGDFSPSGQKNAYAKLQELKSKMRI